MRLRPKAIFTTALALALVGATYLIPAVQTAEAQQGATPPQKVAGDTAVQPKKIDPAGLPVVSGAAAAPEKPQEVLRLTPNSGAQQAAPAGAGPDFDRSNIPGGTGPAAPVTPAGREPTAPETPDADAPDAAGPDAAAPGANAPSRSTTFNGIAQTSFIPPDQALAAGPTHLVEQVNSTIQVFNKNGTSALGPFSLQSWYGAPGSFVFDPVGIARQGSRVANDQLRFYEVAIFRDAGTLDSRVMVAVSSTNNGTSSRCVYHFPGRFNNGTADDAWFDFPKVGITNQTTNLGASRLLIGGNLFRWSNNTFVNNTVIEINKQQIDSCASASFTRWTNFTNSDNSTGFTPVPATDYDNTAGFGWQVVLARFGSGTGLTVWRNRFGVGFERFFADTIDYSNPPAARQPNTATRIDAGDDRLQSAVTRYGITWAVHTVALGGCGTGLDTASLHIVSINTPKSAAAPTLRSDQFQTGACSTDQFNGSVSQDGDGNPLWVYNESGTATFVHLRANGTHSLQGFGSPIVLGAGPCACTETRGRWGDYSAAALDPTDQNSIWLAGEILLGTNNWGTRISKVSHKAPAI